MTLYSLLNIYRCLDTASCLHLKADDNNNQWDVMKRAVLTPSKYRLQLSNRRGVKSQQTSISWNGYFPWLQPTKLKRKKLERILSQLAPQIDGRRGSGRKVLFKRRYVSSRLHDIISYIKYNCHGHRCENLKFVDISAIDYTFRGSTHWATTVYFSIHILYSAATCWSAFQTGFGRILFGILRYTETSLTEWPVWISNFLSF